MLLSEYGTFLLSIFACLVAFVPYSAYGIIRHTRKERIIISEHNLRMFVFLLGNLIGSFVFYSSAKEYFFQALLVYWIGVGIITSFFVILIEEILTYHDDEYTENN